MSRYHQDLESESGRRRSSCLLSPHVIDLRREEKRRLLELCVACIARGRPPGITRICETNRRAIFGTHSKNSDIGPSNICP